MPCIVIKSGSKPRAQGEQKTASVQALIVNAGLDRHQNRGKRNKGFGY